MKQLAVVILTILALLTACSHSGKRPSVKQLRAEKHVRDSIAAVNNERSLAYTDSIIQVLTIQRDSLLQYFEANQNEKYEDEARFVHKRLTTSRNMNRCHIQSYVTSGGKLFLCAHYVGTYPINAERITFSMDSLHTSASASIHRFTTDDKYYERLTVENDDAAMLLKFISMDTDKHFRATLDGKTHYRFILSDDDIKALQDTYRLYVLTQDLKLTLKQHDQFQTLHFRVK